MSTDAKTKCCPNPFERKAPRPRAQPVLVPLRAVIQIRRRRPSQLTNSRGCNPVSDASEVAPDLRNWPSTRWAASTTVLPRLCGWAV